jgi:hypothetical protein
MERLSGLDATFVYAESPLSRFEIASCVIVDLRVRCPRPVRHRAPGRSSS